MFPGIPGVTAGIGGAVRTWLLRALGGDDWGALVEGLDAAAMRVDGGGRLLDLNPRVAVVLGVERRAVVGCRLPDLLPAVAGLDDPDGAVVDVDLDGEHRRMAVSVPVHAADGRWLVLRDATDQERYRRLVETVADPVYVTDDGGRIVAVSDAVVEQLGYDRATLLGSHLSAFVDEDAWAAGEEALSETLAAGDERATFEAEAVTADGERRRYEDNVRVFRDDDGDLDGLVHSIRDVEARHERERAFEQYETTVEALKRRGVVGDGFPDLATVADSLLDADGRTYELTVQPADGGGERVAELQLALRPGEGFIGVLRDATERKRRQEVLTVMNRALRHNLRTNVTTIVGYADLVDREVDGEAESFVQSIRDAADWLAKLGDTLRTLQRAIEANITGDVGVDVGDVVENAVVHSDRETPSVDVWVADAPRDGWVDIHVEDDGPGVPGGERDVVVGDAAITQLQHGSGIGLWLTRWLVEVFDGELVIEDNDPRGTVVTLRLPRSARG